MFLKHAIIFLLLNCTFFKAETQVNVSDFSFEKNDVLQEKILAGTDKDFYLAGEILWFKIYDVSADSLKLLNFSKVAYVEIINAQQNAVLQASVALQNGTGKGSFYLNSSLKSGNYILRAYTNWMKNFGASTFFEKEITIVNTLTTVNVSTNKNPAIYNVDFYAEGGNLIAGNNSKIAFKVHDAYNNSVEATGSVLDENNVTITSFSTLKFGMSSFYFTPQLNHTYKAVININNTVIKKNLPAVSSNGFTMHTRTDQHMLSVAAHTNNNNQHLVYLGIYEDNHLKLINSQYLKNGAALFTINNDSLPVGILHVVLFDENKKPACERLVFIKPQTMALAIAADKNVYATRSRVSINIEDSNIASLSLTVSKTDALQQQVIGDMTAYFYLTSQLNDHVETPDYYFKEATAEQDSTLDNLLLTQGLLMFKYDDHEKQISKPVFAFTPELEGHIIEAKVTDKNSGLPAGKIRVYLSTPGIYFHFASAVSNDSGKVSFDIKDYYGSDEIVVQTEENDSVYHVEVQSPFSDQPCKLAIMPFNLSEDKLALLSTYNLDVQIQNAYSLNKLNIFNQPPTDSFAFYGKPDVKYNLDDYTRFNTMEEVLREYIANVDVRIKQGNYSLSMIDPNSNTFFKNNPLVLVDGVPVLNMNKLMKYDPKKLKKAEVAFGRYHINSLVAEGIVSYSTYKGDLDGFLFGTNATEISYDGLQLERSFYAPEYISAQQKESRLPDYRNILYWEPEINSDKKRQLTFFTSDVKGKYIVSIEGINKDGSLIYGTTSFEGQ